VSRERSEDSRYSRALEAAGVPVAIGHAVDNLGDPQIVVVSSAIPQTNPELAEASVAICLYAESQDARPSGGERRTVAVAGTHGKTSTSSMVATISRRWVSSRPPHRRGGRRFDTNAVNGSGEHFVVEADESDGSFLFLDPHIAIITKRGS